MSYAGNKTFVNCAENQKRYSECADLHICVEPNTTSHEYIKTRWSQEFYQTGLYLDMLENNTCNVLAAERMQIDKILTSRNMDEQEYLSQKYVIGNKTFTTDPLAVVTRNNDRQWSDIINWVIEAIIYGERHGLLKDKSLCKHEAPTSKVPSNLQYLNSVYCVGNYEEIVYNNQVSNVM